MNREKVKKMIPLMIKFMSGERIQERKYDGWHLTDDPDFDLENELRIVLVDGYDPFDIDDVDFLINRVIKSKHFITYYSSYDQPGNTLKLQNTYIIKGVFFDGVIVKEIEPLIDSSYHILSGNADDYISKEEIKFDDLLVNYTFKDETVCGKKMKYE